LPNSAGVDEYRFPLIAGEHEMELVAGSLNVEVDGYLHAGYLSAYPRTFKDMGAHSLPYAKTNLIDVKVALRLENAESQSAHQPTAEVAVQPTALAPASMASDGFLLATLFFFFAYLIGLYYRRIRRVDRPGWHPWLLAVVPLVVVIVASCAYQVHEERRLNSLPPPWLGVPVKNYEDPEAATQAILHGLVVNALPGSTTDVRELAAIQHEVAFPVPAEQYTPGMSYAQKTYGRDGWGREFKFDPLTDGCYRIASAGADGSHGTSDDVVVVTPKKSTDDWEQLVNGVYMRRASGDSYTCFIHRITHSNFRRADSAMARDLTGTELFDTFGLDDQLRHATEEPPVLAQLREYQESHPPGEESDPLFFVHIAPTEDG